MPANANAERRRLEWEALRALCLSFDHAPAATPAEPALSLPLQETHFLDPVHRAIFQEILQCRLRNFSREQLQRRLPEAMTRLGWPDLDFDALFSAARHQGSADAADPVRKLCASTQRESERG